jgi:predicted RNA-binding protein with PUA-like domain
MATKSYWLLKSEPETYSYSDLVRDKKTNWNGVRNFQARNNLRKAAVGDLALIYHSGDDKAVVGVAEVVREAYAEIDQDDGSEWAQIDLRPVKALKTPVTLAQIKTTKALADIPLIKQSRLSCMQITAAHYQTITKLGGL